MYNDAQPCTQKGDVTSLLQLHEWHPTNAYDFLPLATSTRWSSPFDHSRKSTAIVLLFLRVFLLDSTMSSQHEILRRSYTRPTKDTESDGNHPLSGAIKPLVEKGMPLMAQSWKPGRGEFPRQTFWIHGNKDRRLPPRELLQLRCDDDSYCEYSASYLILVLVRNGVPGWTGSLDGGVC
jgi:hypothetical protein